MHDKEIICVHIGQAGIQIGNAVWELLSIEHELDGNGHQICYSHWPLIDNTNSLFFEVGNGKFKPRSLMIDSEPLVIEEIRTGFWQNMFDAKSLICGRTDASAIFAKGYNSDDLLQESVTYLRVLMEEASSLNGFLIFHSLGGGTGSGLTSRITEIIQSEAPKKPIIHMSIVPPTNKTGFMVEPYNGVLSTAALLESSSLMCMMENEALYKTVELLVDQNKLSYININRHISQITSSLTTSYRFTNKLSSDFSVFQTNLVPFPEIHFPISSYAQSNEPSDTNLVYITKSCFTKEYMTLNLDPSLGSFMSCCLLYRGMKCSPMTINKAVKAIKSNLNNKFVDWSPTSFKIAINVQMPGTVPCSNIPETKQSLCVLSNSTAITQIWIRLLYNFQSLLSRKLFLHWFAAEGVEKDILKEAEERITDLISKYNDLETNKDISYLNSYKPQGIPGFLKKMNVDSQSKVPKPIKETRINETTTTKPTTTNKTRSTSTNQRNSNDNVELKIQGSRKESVDEVSGSQDQYNLSSKYTQMNYKFIRKPSDIVTGSDSHTDSMFINAKDGLYRSSETINALLSPSSSTSSQLKCLPFSKILHQSILDLHHFQNEDKLPSFHRFSTSKHFISQFRRLDSRIMTSRSHESMCNIRHHACHLNCLIDSLEYISVLFGRFDETKDVFDEIKDFPEIEYCISEMNHDLAVTTSTGNLFIALIYKSQIIESLKSDIFNEKETLSGIMTKGTEIACQTNKRKSLSRIMSQLFYRKSVINGLTSTKKTFSKRLKLRKTFSQPFDVPKRKMISSCSTGSSTN